MHVLEAGSLRSGLLCLSQGVGKTGSSGSARGEFDSLSAGGQLQPLPHVLLLLHIQVCSIFRSPSLHPFCCSHLSACRLTPPVSLPKDPCDYELHLDNLG